MNEKPWPRLGSLPSTNALLTLVGSLWLLTGICALVHWSPPDRWYQALETFTGIIVIQFASKRFSYKEPKNAAVPPV